MRKSVHILICCLLILAAVPEVCGQTPPKPRDTTITGPQTFAMIMGISKYKNVRPLTYADKDAEMFRDFLKSPAGGKLSNDNIYCLVNEQALAANFLVSGFKWLKAKSLQKGDRLFIYMSGHGDAIDEDNFFYLAYDCNPAGDKNNYLVSGTVRMYDVKSKIAREAAKGVDVYLIMDACRSNELPGGAEGQGFFNQAISEKRAGEIMMLATGAGQESLEDVSIGNGHGLFTYYLVDGLNGMADTQGDNKVSLEEIQKYVDKNVPNVAQERFKRKQDPFFCCSEMSTKTVSQVDSAYLRKWIDTKKIENKRGTSFSPKSRGGGNSLLTGTADTLVLEAYNRFNDALKDYKLIGKNSAESYYNYLYQKYPNSEYTNDAQSALAVAFINFAQTKINLYLDCRDAASIQRLRAQIDKEDAIDEISVSLERMEKVAQLEYADIGDMLEKAINYITPDDPDFAKALLGRMYFFKARGYFGRSSSRKVIDRNTAFSYAYIAYGAEPRAAYILNTLSSLHLDNNRYDSAIYYAKQALAIAPRWRYPYVTLAYAYKTTNQPDSAIKYYKSSIDVDPKNADAYVDIGHYYYSLNQGDSAVRYYERALQIEPNNPYASNNIGWVSLSNKKYNEAINSFKQSIESNPRFVNAYNGLSKTFLELKQFDSARIYYTKAMAYYPDKSIVNVYIGNLYRDLKMYDSAKQYYRLASEADPFYEEPYNNLGMASQMLKQLDSAIFFYRKAFITNPGSANALMNIGKVYRELNNRDSSYFYYKKALTLQPGSPAILNTMGAIYGADKVYDSAKAYFRRSLLLKPDYKPAMNNLLKIFRELKEVDSITTFMKVSSPFDRKSASFMNNLGMLYLDFKRYDSAQNYFRKALQIDPRNGGYLNNMALVHQGLKNYDSARIFMQQAMAFDPENKLIWGNLGNIFKQLGMADSAAFYIKKQIFGKTGMTPQTYFSLATLFGDMEMYDSSVYYFHRALDQDPKHLSTLNGLGVSFMKQEKNDSAIIYFQRAFDLSPRNATSAYRLGIAHHAMKNYDRAIELFKATLTLDGGKPTTWYQLGTTYAVANKTELAVDALKMAIEKGYKPVTNLQDDPDFADLLKIPAYQSLLNKYVPDWKNR